MFKKFERETVFFKEDNLFQEEKIVAIILYKL